MFQSSDKNQLVENIKEWNEKQSQLYPHCQICLLFKNQKCSEERNSKKNISFATSGKNDTNHKLPVNSETFIPEICFTKKTKLQSLSDFNDENIDCLLQCKMCKLTVHQSIKN